MPNHKAKLCSQLKHTEYWQFVIKPRVKNPSNVSKNHRFVVFIRVLFEMF